MWSHSLNSNRSILKCDVAAVAAVGVDDAVAVSDDVDGDANECFAVA